MYQQRFGLKHRPFPATPDDALYYPATSHEQGLAALTRAIGEDDGLMLLTGEPGTGKSLLGHMLPGRVTSAGKAGSGDLVASYIAQAIEPGRRALLQAILFDLQLPHEEGSEQTLRLRLVECLLKNCAAGVRTLLVLDEAQNLTPDHLEEIRCLGNLEASGKKAFQVVLLGQPALLDTLKKPELTALQQRLAVRCRIDPLGAEEAYDYLLHHVRLAGGKPEKILEEAALEVLARGTHGVPRLLNQAAHQALHLADAADLDKVDAEAALEAMSLLGLVDIADENEGAEEEDTSNEGVVRLVEETRRTA